MTSISYLFKKYIWFTVSIISICALCSLYLIDKKVEASEPYYVYANNFGVAPNMFVDLLNKKYSEGYVFDQNVVLTNNKLDTYHITIFKKK